MRQKVKVMINEILLNYVKKFIETENLRDCPFPKTGKTSSFEVNYFCRICDHYFKTDMENHYSDLSLGCERPDIMICVHVKY